MTVNKIQQELMGIFQAELEENLESVNKGLLSLEKSVEPEEQKEIVTTLFRSAHNIKGSSGVVSLVDIRVLSHRMEDVLKAIQEKKLTINSDLLDTLFSTVDALRDSMTAHLKGELLPEERKTALINMLEEAAKGNVPPQKRSSPISDTVPGLETPGGGLVGEKSHPSDLAPESLVSQPQNPVAKGNLSETQPIPQQELKPAASTTNPRPSSPDSIRVSTAKLDALIESLGELLVICMRSEQLQEDISHLQQELVVWQKAWRRVRPGFNRLLRQKDEKIRQDTFQKNDVLPLLDFLSANDQHRKKISGQINTLLPAAINNKNRLGLLSHDLQNRARQTRMMPFEVLFDTFPRLVRDIGRENHKDVYLHIKGAEVEVDRVILDTLKDPLIHILRNAIGHGIEDPAERTEQGKPPAGKICLNVEQKGTVIILEISDDGKGIDLEAVRRTAVRLGFLTEEAAAGLSQQEVLNLIFLPAFSTQDGVNDLSGRGIGLDVAHKNLEQINGLVQVNTEYLKGTSFTFSLPLTMATNDVLLINAAGQVFGLPITNVERILWMEPGNVGSIEGKPVISYDNHPLPLIILAQVLQLPQSRAPVGPAARIPLILVGSAEKRVALQVDNFIGTNEVVIKKLGRQLNRVRNVIGGAILGSGQVVIILNPADLVRDLQTRTKETLEPEAMEKRQPHILLADDSITTRTLEKNILENAGYRVTVAADGMEAWEFVQSEKPDIIISDVDMPRLDGFSLTEKVKGDNRFKELPIILVTSLETPADKMRGLNAGADAYITKSSFDQRTLLETIEQQIR
jgi:two-component system chemotaxis sensor kinase CheA